jgi:predicted amidohydrolase YtcJ
MLKNVFILTAAIVITACSNKKTQVDLVVHNGVVYPAEPSSTIYGAFAVKDGKIVEIGSEEQIVNKYQGAETVDANGMAVLPGLIDAHCHFTGYATDMWKCSLVGTTSFKEVLERANEMDLWTRVGPERLGDQRIPG